MTKTTTRLLSTAFAAALFAAPAFAQDPKPTPAPEAAQKSESKMTKTPSGLQYEDTKVGTGASPQKGQTCVMNYTGWLWENGAKGKKFDSSLDRGTPFSFPIGQGRVIKGWDEGVATMKVGGKRTLLIPPDLGYGSRGAGGVIPPNATLIFEVELLDVK
jgi:peptidylprolyl isomerase